MSKPDRPINARSNNANAQARIATFQNELAQAGKPKILKADGSVASKAVDPAKPKPADRPAIHRLAYLTAATQAELDRALGTAPTPAARPQSPTPPARARAKTPAAPTQRQPAATPATPAPSPAPRPKTEWVSVVDSLNLGRRLGISVVDVAALMRVGVIPREFRRSPDGAQFFWLLSNVPAIARAVRRHAAGKQT